MKALYTFLGVLAVLGVCCVGSVAWAASWSSFLPADFEDVYVTPPLAGGTLSYTLSLGEAPTVSFEGNTYNIKWVSAFYAVADTRRDCFYATEGESELGWRWEAKDRPGVIAGWHGTGQNRLYAGDEAKFWFGSLEPEGTNIVFGLHVGYCMSDGVVMTDYRRSTSELLRAPRVPPIPELPASALAVLGGLVAPLVAKLRYRG